MARIAVVAIFAVVVAVALATDASTQKTGSFSVIAYNTHYATSSAKAYAIGQILKQFDVVNVQEDFYNHRYIKDGDAGAHAYLTSTSGIPSGTSSYGGSGLNTLSKFPFTGFERVSWTICYGGLEDGADCLVNKGYTAMTVEVASGVYVDMYNLHANSGTASGDENARRTQLSQLAAAITTRSAGRAVIVFGDTNCRYTRADDELYSRLIAPAGLSDAWVTLVRGTTAGYPAPGSTTLDCSSSVSTSPSCETVDKIFYRSAADVSIVPTRFYYANNTFVDASGAQLSDHIPPVAEFAFATDSRVSRSELVGGSGGSQFDFLGMSLQPFSGTSVKSVSVRGAARIDAISFAYTDGSAVRTGGNGGADSTLSLASGECIISADVSVNTRNGDLRVFYIKLTTSTGRHVSNGVASGTATTFSAPSGACITGAFGRSAVGIDQIGFIYAKK